MRTEEARALTWEHVDLDGQPDASPPVPPSVFLNVFSKRFPRRAQPLGWPPGVRAVPFGR